MSDEKESEVVGNYLIVTEKSYSQGPRNPLDDDEYAGKLYGNHSTSRSEWGSMGEKYEFRAARGNYDSNENLDTSDYLEQAALLVIAETSFDEALEALEEHFEWSDEERADVVAFRVDVMTAFAEHVMKEYNRSWPKIPNIMYEEIQAKAELLAIADVKARVVGNKYAIPMSLSGYHTMELQPDEHRDISEMELDDVLWVPSDLATADLDALPYREAMKKAVSQAKSDGEEYANWASGNVWDIKVKVYRLELDEDEDDLSEDPDFYENKEPVFEDAAHERVGETYADQEMARMLEEAKEWVAEAELENAEPESSSPAMSM
jgi:hypothetical protein